MPLARVALGCAAVVAVELTALLLLGRTWAEVLLVACTVLAAAFAALVHLPVRDGPKPSPAVATA